MGAWLRARAWGALDALGFVACVATVLGFASRLGWPVELAAHFRVQYLVVVATLALLCAWAGRRNAAWAFSAFALANAAVVLPVYLGGPRLAEAAGTSLRLMLANVATHNRDSASVIKAVRDVSPDVIVFEEIDPRWMQQLSELSETHPFVVSEPRRDNFGIATFSRQPLEDSRVVFIGAARVPSIVLRIPFDGTTMTVVATHPLPPRSSAYAALRDEQLLRLGEYVAELPPPYALIGDLNVSPWSHPFYRLLVAGRLKDTRWGIGSMPTWPAEFWPLLVPIDHCLVSEDLRAVGRQVGPFVGSDHYPIVVDLALARGGSGERHVADRILRTPATS
jgi:endonuclease/exonuclease/phosphatase (EEP) superfamily protein YafD